MMGELVRVPLRSRAPLQVLDGFGRAVRAASRYAAPHDVDELQALLARAGAEGLRVAFRGSGRSYGDAALNGADLDGGAGLVLDTRGMNRMLAWDPQAGIAEAEPGLTIEGLWRRTLADGWWPHVVPGTMLPTLGGCLAMNIHGKNNFRAGPFGEHVLDFDLVTPQGDKIRCSRDEEPELFHAAIGGLGLLGAITRVRLQLKRVESGLLRVRSICGHDLDHTFDLFEEHLPHSDYLVGWIDCTKGGRGLGRSELHRANYLCADEDPEGPRSFDVERQGLPERILGFPRRHIWRFMRPFMNGPGVRLVNALKYHAARLGDGKSYLQSHVAFAFLLDYVPDWRLAYGPGGLIQHQVFLPYEGARRTLRELLALCLRRGLPSTLGVLKRHRPDAFLLSHALDGWSFAMDFRVTAGNRAALWALCHELTERVLDAGGRFYFAKDAVLRPDDAARAYGRERLDRFLALKARLDPHGLLASDLYRRVLAP